MSSVMRWRSGVIDDSFAEREKRQSATPLFRNRGRQKRTLPWDRRGSRPITGADRGALPRSGLVQCPLSRVFMKGLLLSDAHPFPAWRRWRTYVSFGDATSIG